MGAIFSLLRYSTN